MDASQRLVYRRLLRAIRASVKFQKPAAANLRRALRDDFRAALSIASQGPTDAQLEQSARNTIALLLSSAFSPRRNALDTSHIAGVKVRAAQLASTSKLSQSSSNEPVNSKKVEEHDPTLHHSLAHKVVENLASLVYHHLSPHSQMQPLSKRSGGTQNTTLASGRSSSRAQSTSNPANDIALDMMGGSSGTSGGDGDWSDGEEPIGSGRNYMPFSGQYRIPSLSVPPKPVRGPMGHRPARWDGQKPMSVFLMQQQGKGATTTTTTSKSSESLTALEARVLSLVEAYRTSKSTHGESSPRTQKLLQEVRQVRGVLRSATRKAEQEERKRAVEKLPQEWMYDLVRRAEESEKVWLGGQRFGRWVRGVWLPP
ncbi:hypothetical protein A4X13_0g6431 [Tilletia indica]|uniref:Uncharacterized protein n=1 Tax=Tilletia indica TaxID=43049 RepID=A0A177TXG4_9BASI|nr:hypothetical protein A4X13_0g6431 [Tilletia indica]